MGDVLVEALLMARCGALLSTYSNVSVAAVYFSSPGYRHFMFGDVPPSKPREESSIAAPLHSPVATTATTTTTTVSRHCATCNSIGVTLCCSRCHTAFFCNRECQRRGWQEHKRTCIA